jgi:hypothetical protein
MSILAVASLAVTAVGGYMAYNASKQAQKYNDQVAKVGQKVAEARAVDAERLGQVDAQERRLKTRLMLGSQTVGFAAQNVAASGTALDILGDTAMFGEIDETRIRANAARQAWGYRMEGWNIKANNALAKFQGKVDRMGTILTTAGGLIKGAGQFNFGGGGGGLGSGTTSLAPASAPDPYLGRVH